MVVVVAIIVWGALSAWSWMVAALSYGAFGALRDVVYGPEWQTRSAGALTLLVAVALIALIMRHAPRLGSINRQIGGSHHLSG